MDIEETIKNMSPAQREALLRSLTRSSNSQQKTTSKPKDEVLSVSRESSTLGTSGTEQSSPKPYIVQDTTPDTQEFIFDNAFEKHDSLVEASYDRKMMRLVLDTGASTSEFNAAHCAELHKWWDGTGYELYNDWLFTDESFITIKLINSNGEEKELRLKVSI